jgi:hypothetical protein
MIYKYLIVTGSMIWGKKTLDKESFVHAVQRSDTILDLEEGTYFDKDDNTWKAIEGDE